MEKVARSDHSKEFGKISLFIRPHVLINVSFPDNCVDLYKCE